MERTPNRSVPSPRINLGITNTPTTMGTSCPSRFQIVLRASRDPRVRSLVDAAPLFTDRDFAFVSYTNHVAKRAKPQFIQGDQGSSLIRMLPKMTKHIS